MPSGRALLGAALAAMALAAGAADRAPAARPEWALRNVTVVNVADGSLAREQTVIIAGDRVRAVAPTASVRLTADTHVIDGRGRYLIPGLWDMHVHSLVFESDPDWIFPLLIAHGVTGIREMGSEVPIARARRVRDDVASGRRVGPRMRIGGPLIDGYNTVWEHPLGLPTPHEAVTGLRTLKAQGADFIRVTSLIPRDAYLSALAEARRLGIPVAGAIPETITATEAAQAGQSSVEHLEKLVLGCSDLELEVTQARAQALEQPDALELLYFESPRQTIDMLERPDETRCAALLATLARAGTAVVPSLVSEDSAHPNRHDLDDPRLELVPAPLVARWIDFDESMASAPAIAFRLARELEQAMVRLVKPLASAGVRILAGSNAGAETPFVLPGASLHDELARLVAAGLTPLEALQAATSNPARFFGAARSSGCIAAGCDADFVLLEADPLADIRNTRRIAGVAVHGRWLDRQGLDALVLRRLDAAR